jgi:hypothetical protein
MHTIQNTSFLHLQPVLPFWEIATIQRTFTALFNARGSFPTTLISVQPRNKKLPSSFSERLQDSIGELNWGRKAITMAEKLKSRCVFFFWTLSFMLTVISLLTLGVKPLPLKDKSTAKDILKLVEPTNATDDLKALFGNQVVPLNEVVLADKERDRKNNNVSFVNLNNDWRLICDVVPCAYTRVC